MRRLALAVLLLAGCDGLGGSEDVTGELPGTGAEYDRHRVACATETAPGAYTATFLRWEGWYVECPSMPKTLTAHGSFDGVSWCSLAGAASGLAACADYSCVPGPTSTEAGRVEVAFDCNWARQRYYMTVSPR